MTPIVPFRRPLEEQEREARFVQSALEDYWWREEDRREAERIRRWRRMKPWIGAGIAGLILGGCFWAVMAILR